jgi:alpha-L-fucosidase 2
LDFLWERKGRFERFAREFYETDGLAVPGVMTLAGEPLAGWVQYSLSPTMTSWSAHLFYLHWRYTGDDKFLRTRAYPWCREAGVSVEQLLVERDGRLVLPLSSSPEIFDNSDRAWMKPNSNYDLMSLRMQFLSLAEMAQAVGDRKDSEHWKSLSDRLGEYHVREDGTLKLNKIEDLPGSHRHLSNLMGIHPFNLITVDGGYGDVRMINRSLEEWEAKGTQGWTGYSFSWMAAVMARVGRGDDAYKYLDIYRRAFLLRNGFHANGDQTDQGYSSMHYRPFTLEGNFLAMNAIHEMLLQSWSPSPGVLGSEVIRVFPAIPKTWDTVSFRDLRSEGGYTVSASRTEGRQVIEIKVSQDGVLRVQNNYSGEWKWNREDVRLKGRVWEVQVKSGDVVQAGISRGDG